MARPQVNMDLGAPEAVRTTARPLGSSAPVASIGQSRGAALAQSLAGIEPRLQGFIQEMNEDYREKEANRAYDQIQGMTYDQAKEAVTSGQLRETESPWFQAAFQKQFGMAHAANRRREVVEAYNNEFDKQNGDIDSFLAKYAQQDFEAYQGQDFVLSGMREGMAGVFGKIKDDHAEFKSGFVREQTSDNFIAIARGEVEKAVAEGANPMERVRTLYGPHREALGLTFAEMDDMAFQIAREAAENGDLETVEAMMNYEAVGDDGQKVGSFLSRSKYSLDARSLLETAKANRGSNNRENSTMDIVDLRVRASGGMMDDRDLERLNTMVETQTLTTEAREALIEENIHAKNRVAGSEFVREQTGQVKNAAMALMTQGRAYTLQDVSFKDPYTGKVHDFTAEELIDEAANDQLNAMAAKGATPQVMAAQMASWGIDTTYSVWENAMSNGYFALSESLAKMGKDGKIEVPEPALAGFQIWKSMADQPRLRDAHVKDGTAASIYRDAEALVRVGIPEEDALLRSASIDRKNGRESLSTAVDRNAFQSAVTKAVGGGWGGGDNALNGTDVAKWIEQSVRVQMDLGIGMKDAIANGVKAYKDSHQTINGTAINVRDAFIPNNFDEITDVALHSFAQAADEDVRDLTLMPAHDGSNYWIIAHKSTRLPVAVPNVSNRFHISQLQQGVLDAKEPAAIDAINDEVRQNAAPSVTYEEWQQMTRKQRQDAGLPTSTTGGEWLYRHSK